MVVEDDHRFVKGFAKIAREFKTLVYGRTARGVMPKIRLRCVCRFPDAAKLLRQAVLLFLVEDSLALARDVP